MIPEQIVLDVINDLNKDRTKTLAEFIAILYKDKFIELYLGDSYEEVSTEQVSTAYPAVFCGKVIAAYRECLIISAAYVKDKKIQIGNLMLVNERAIRALNEVDGDGILEEMFLRSKETLGVKDAFHKEEAKNR